EGLRPSVASPRETAQKSRRPRAVVAVKDQWCRRQAAHDPRCLGLWLGLRLAGAGRPTAGWLGDAGWDHAAVLDDLVVDFDLYGDDRTPCQRRVRRRISGVCAACQRGLATSRA